MPVARPPVGDWLWACRVGAEEDLCDELREYKIEARMLQPGLVASTKRPADELCFARQGFPVKGICPATVDALVPVLMATLKRAFAVQVFAADSDEGGRLAGQATALQEALATALSARGLRVCADGVAAKAEGALLAQVCLLSATVAIYGEQSATSAPSVYPGGVQRVRRPRGAPSRSAHKLVEALAWLGHGPDANDQCIDLGAAPGGWSLVLAERRCPVIAVDLGALAPGIARKVRHVRANAFEFTPDEPADWLFCDMAYRPLEVAALLARWGRYRWARFLVANIKLPMKKRVDMLRRVREILTSGGWTGMRVRQLYHDREEVSLFAWRGFGIDTRVPNRKPAESTDERKSPQRGRPAPRPAGRSGTREERPGQRSSQRRAPTSDRPTSDRPTSDRPASGRPTSSRPASDKPASRRPTSGKPTSGRPPSRKSTGKPTGRSAPPAGSKSRPSRAPTTRSPQPRRGKPRPSGGGRGSRPAR